MVRVLNPKWMRRAEVARWIGVSESTVRYRGKIGHYDVLRTPLGELYDRGSVERWLRQHETEHEPAPEPPDADEPA
jgi:hypothetical protein